MIRILKNYDLLSNPQLDLHGDFHPSHRNR